MLHHMLRAAAQRAFSTLDPYFKYVTMLLHGDGSALGSDTVTPFNSDASTNNFNITINGDARSNNFNPYQAGYYSNYFNGTSGQYLNAPANTVFNFGTGDFTVEAWVYPTSTSGTRPIIEIRTSGGANGFAFLSQSGATTLNVYTNGGFVGASTNSLTLNAWNHVALTRSTNTWTYWINGVSGGSFTNSSTQSDGGTTGPKIGGSTTAGEIWIGYISNARITKGAALYTTTFTPSTTPLTTTVSSGTVSLLTSQSNRFIDNSVNAFTITVNGSPQVSPAQPFTLPSSVATYGSGYFDGTGDSLSLASSSTALPTGTQDFSVEMYLYWQTQGGSYPQLISNPTTNGFQIYYDVASGLLAVGIFNVSNVITYTIAQTALAGAWTHLVVTRSGNTFRMFVNGVLRANGTNTISFASLTTQYIASDGSRPYTGYMTDVRTVLGAIPTGYQTSSTTNGTSVFTPPTSPLTAVSNTALLTTQYNGAGNNNGFKDSSQNNFTITRNGNTTQGTFTPYGSNWSVNFTGAQTSPSLTYPSISAYDLGATSQWTYECWVYFASLSGEQSIMERWSGTGGPGWLLTKLSTNVYRAHFGSSVYIDTGAIAVAGQWIHLAVSRDGSTGSIFVDGVRQATTSSVANFSDGTDPLVFGERNSGSQTFPFNGYISNARIVKGAYVYNPSSTSITVPTAPLTAITNTVFLGLQSNRYIDNSSNNATATVSSASSIQRFSPFSPTTAYSTSVIGGSGYFDGSGDYLTVPQNAAFNFGTGAFTVEAFVYLTAYPSGGKSVIFSLGNGADVSPATYTGWALTVTSTQITFYRYDGTETEYVASAVIPLNAWSHVVAVRNGSSNFAIYLNGTRVLSTTTSLSYNNVNTNNLNISYWTSGGGTARYITGYISNGRIVAGTAVYDPTSSTLTVPTAPLTAISGTSLLMNYTNAGILDNAMMNDLETVGNAQISTSVKKYGTGSMYFDGSGDWLQAPNNAIYNLGGGDFTIEFWLYVASNPSVAAGLVTKASNAGNTGYTIFYYPTGYVGFAIGSGGLSVQSSASSISTTTWTHVAITRSGTSGKFFINGTQSGSTGTINNFTDSSTVLAIGALDTSTGWNGNYPFNGYIDDLRITKGVARYTTTFTPPTAAFPNN